MMKIDARPPAIQNALEQLGYGPCYHMRVAMNQYPQDCAMWMKALEAKFDGKGKLFGREEWDQLLGRYRVSKSPYRPITFSPEECCLHK